VNVRRQVIRLIERADTDELHERPGPGVMSPHRDAAARTARDLLAETACGRRVDDLGAGPRSVTRSDSIIALSANAVPLSRWHQRQWQQWTNSGRVSMR
jgi:hypothetical protein